MKKGISIWSFAEGTLKEKMKLAKDAGCDGIELALDETGEVSIKGMVVSLDIREIRNNKSIL